MGFSRAVVVSAFKLYGFQPYTWVKELTEKTSQPATSLKYA